MQNKKPLFYLIVAALLALAIKYSSSIFDSASLILSVLMPLIIGCIIAYILNILVVKIESLPIFKNTSSPVYKARRAISILASLLIIALVIVLLVKTIIPQLGSALSLIISEIPPAISRFIDWIHSKNVEIPQLEEWLASLDINWQKISSYIISGSKQLIYICLFSAQQFWRHCCKSCYRPYLRLIHSRRKGKTGPPIQVPCRCIS